MSMPIKEKPRHCGTGQSFLNSDLKNSRTRHMAQCHGDKKLCHSIKTEHEKSPPHFMGNGLETTAWRAARSIMTIGRAYPYQMARMDVYWHVVMPDVASMILFMSCVVLDL